ncbi:hypothetical protein FEK33_26160 [Nocardia asteroides NBRC 15531]|nr:hypothetical protein FEK33_26160 [Nocardia asteroides NBRC 15531]
MGRLRTLGGGVALHPAVPRRADRHGPDQLRHRLPARSHPAGDLPPARAHRPDRARAGRRHGGAGHRRRAGTSDRRQRCPLMPRSRVQLALIALLVLVVVAWFFTR